VTTKLAHQTQKVAGISNGMRTATVAAVDGTSVTLSVAGGQFSSGVGVITSYAPIVGETVAVFRQDSSWLILGPTSAVNAWQPFTGLGYQNGWTDLGSGFPVGQYRQAADEVKLVGAITNAGIPSSGQVIVSGIPAPPVSIVALGAMGTTRVRMQVTAAGELKVFDATVSGTCQFCFAYPLDCLAG
jgi:hypothetical protein